MVNKYTTVDPIQLEQQKFDITIPIYQDFIAFIFGMFLGLLFILTWKNTSMW